MERGTIMEINYKDIENKEYIIAKAILERECRYPEEIKNITQEKLAEISGVSVTHMSNIENANTKLSLPVLINIANALDCDSSILLFGNSTSNLNSSLLIISNILLDCTSDERIIIIDTIQALKNSLRENRKEV